MCGIAGVVSLRGVTDEDRCAVLAATAWLAHRGPDDEGEYIDDFVALGMRRLAIIDRVGGRQPMSTPDGRFTLIFNGEIYNYRDLRDRLVTRGVRFTTASDSEVLLRYLETHGAAGLDDVNGMFAFALWDRARRELILARDRLGEKPLYYARPGDRLCFASELPSLLAFPGIDDAIDAEAMFHYLSFLSVPAPLSIYRGVRKLEPGHFLRFGPRGAEDIVYWRLPSVTGTPPVHGEVVERVGALLLDSVSRRLISDVPLGAFLSGGLDSSSVVAVMARAGCRPLRTYTAAFPGLVRHDESAFARRVAEFVGAEHHEIPIEPDDVSALPDVVARFGEPYADHSALPLYLLARQARRSVTVVLTGDGGDEVFGGYPWYRWEGAARVLARLGIFRAREAPRGEGWRNRVQRLLHASGQPFGHRRILWSYALTEDAKRELLETTAPVSSSWTSAGFLEGYLDGHTWADGAMRVDLVTLLPNEMLTKVDRMTMAHGLEARVPLLDHRLVELCASLPVTEKLRRGRAKALLKEAMRPYLPGWVLGRTKRGFNLPVDEWIRGPLRPMALDLLSADTVRRRGWFKPEVVGAMLEAEVSGTARVGQTVWGLMVLELWFQQRSARATLPVGGVA